MTEATLTGPFTPPATGKPPRRLVVLLHGYGADGNDLIGLAPLFAHTLQDTAFHSPHAPEPCEMAPMGRQWFSLRAYDPDMLRRNAETLAPALRQMEAGARQAAPILDAYIDGLLDHYGLSPDRLMLLGFSQGTMMALHVGLRRKVAPAAILGYSGALLGPETLAAEITARPPVTLVHGEADEVVPPEASQIALQTLLAAGVTADLHLRPGLPHGIDDEGAQLGRAFLAAQSAAPAGG